MDGYGLIVETLISTLFLYFVWSVFVWSKERPSLRSVAILVLGDIGRSPRMMYHAESFANNGFKTFLIGYDGSQPAASLLTLPVQIVHLTETPSMFKGLPFLLLAPLKIAIQVFTILHTLFVRIPQPPEYIMVQNPPSIPTLALVYLVCKIRGCKLIIDWHNLGYSILELRLGKGHPLVKVAEWFEKTFGRTAYVHLFVTNAMKDFLVKEWVLQGTNAVLHDRPPAHFHRASADEAHDLFVRLKNNFLAPSLSKFLPEFKAPQSTPFTDFSSPPDSPDVVSLESELSGSFSLVSTNYPSFREDRPALVISSTSWTPDEDFGMLLEALKLYEDSARLVNESEVSKEAGQNLPKLFMIVTGKGPLKEAFMSKILSLEDKENWRWVRCRSLWLNAEDYPLMLGSADLGVCLHSSSSALDFPMKIVDMFGCGLPVCALDFKCLNEVLKVGQNGVKFSSSSELASQLQSLLTGFPHAPALDGLCKSFDHRMKNLKTHHGGRDAAGEWEWGTWSENWNNVMLPLVSRDRDRNRSEGVY